MSYESLQAAHDAIVAALQAAADGLPDAERFVVVGEVAELVDPPAAVVAPPELTWDGPPGCGPRVGTWPVYLVVPASDRTVAALYGLLPTVADALDGVADAVMRSSEPGTWQGGTTALPAFLLRVEVAL